MHPASTNLEFTAHNIQLENGRRTRPKDSVLLGDTAWAVSAKRALKLVYPYGVQGKRIVDLGCLEGGFTVEFARMGFSAVGIEVRQTNFACCTYAKENLSLPNLEFVRDTVWNLEQYGKFDAIFCCGLLYHLDRPREFMNLLARTGTEVVILNTHFAPEVLAPGNQFNLSKMEMNEGLPGRWYNEHNARDIDSLESLRWASWENQKSFWLTKRAILQTLYDLGFELVFEQFDWLGSAILAGGAEDHYESGQRGIFIGIRGR